MRTTTKYNKFAKHDGLLTLCFLPSPLLALANFPRFVGGSAAAAGELVEKLGGKLLQYLFIAEIASLGGKSKLKAPVYSMVQLDE